MNKDAGKQEGILLPLDPSPAASAVAVALAKCMFHSFWR